MEVSTVFGTVVFFVHSWSVRGFLFQLPSFLYYSRPGEILSIFCYMMAFALLESTLVTGGLILLSIILPMKWFRQGFVYKSFLTTVVASVAITLLQGYTERTFPPFDVIYRGMGISSAILISLILAFHNIKFLQRGAEFIMDKLSIMAYIYVPLGIISLIVVIYRNLL